jgi:hypothetical protein
MKPKYLLITYEKFIQELKNKTNFDKEKILNVITKNTTESYLCYKINYSKTKSTTQYKVNPPIHNLHPLAPILEQTLQVTNQDWEFEMEAIRDQLGIPFSKLKYFHPSDSKEKYFYLTADIALQALTVDHLFFLYISITLKSKNLEIISSIKQQTFNLKSNKAVEQFLFKKQAAIESVKNRIIKEINPKTFAELFEIAEDNHKTNGFRSMFLYLEKLSRFIEKDYSKFLNPQTTIAYRTLICDENKNIPKINAIKDFLIKSNINIELFKIIINPISKITNPCIFEKITVEEYKYISKIIEAIYKEILQRSNLLSQALIEDWLLDYNFNSTELLQYLQSNIIKDIDNLINDSDKLNLINLQIKKYNQLLIKISQRLHSKLPSTKSKMIKWLEDERNYLLNKMVPATNISSNISEKDKAKLHTDLTVAQITYFFGLLLQTEIIKHQNQREIFRFIADNFKTNTTDKISVESISTKFYNIEEATKKQVRDKLNKMLNLTKTLLFIGTFLEDFLIILD